MGSEQPRRRHRLRQFLFEIGGAVAFTIFVFGAIAFLSNGGKTTDGSLWDRSSGTGMMCWLIAALLFFAVAELCSIADKVKG